MRLRMRYLGWQYSELKYDQLLTALIDYLESWHASHEPVIYSRK